MEGYIASRFIEEINKKAKHLSCPFCGCNNFTTTESMAKIIIDKDFKAMDLGTTIPAGMIVCTNCGHMEFFALGSLGLLPQKEGKDGEQEK